jgi:hypothetical protein
MNITPQVPNLSIPTVLNPHTESLRRENNQREIISQPAATSQSAAEKGVASDRERSRTPAQNNANIDFASISEQAELANTSVSGQDEKNNSSNGQETGDAEDPKGSTQESKENTNSVDGEEQTQTEELEEARVISELRSRDKEVRAHEAAHAAVGGIHTGSPNFSYEQGPDGKRYAVGGEVSVDLSSVSGDPRATIVKMQKVHAAALAPVNPSIQDTRVASIAAQTILQSQSELLTELSSNRNKNEAKENIQESKKASLTTDVDSDKQSSSQTFDAMINQTLKNQDEIAPSQPEVVVKRALRIESFYADITQAYEKPPSFKFELTA